MEGKNIYLSVFPEYLGLLSFCLLKLTKNIDLQVMRVTMIFRITRLSLSTGWNKKIRITLSTEFMHKQRITINDILLKRDK